MQMFFENSVIQRKITTFATLYKTCPAFLREGCNLNGKSMSTKKRILFIAHEMSPYLELTEFSEIANKLAIKTNDNNFEVRCIMPRFGTINERRHRLHEVVRLSGINVSVDNEDMPLQIKVASLPSARLQVYFLDNEDLFRRKFVFHDENEKWYDDNGLRTVFYCKGALETVKKFGWPPDIIHCSGWMTGLIPAYLKTVYKKEPVFAHSKIVYTIGQNTFKEKLGPDFIKKALIHASLKDKDLEIYKDANNTAMFRGGASFADAITFGAAKIEKKLVDEFSKVKGKKTLPYNPDGDLTDYLQLYGDLAGK
jgi:starch synthase